jgi:hypothetical protein
MTATLDFDEFHHALLDDAEGRRLAAPHVRELGPLAFSIDDGRAYTFAASGDTVDIRRGTAGAATIIGLSAADWASFVTERFTRYGVLYNANPRFDAGDFTDLCRWEPALRALFHGRPVYDPRQTFVDRHGAPLDLARSFTLDDDPADLGHFLQTTGYLHVRGVFDAAEIRELGAEVDRLVALARPDDLRSWWTKSPSGEPAVCQLKYGALGSPLITELHHDARVRALIDASGEHALAPNLDRNEGTKIIIKHPGATEGLTDLPLHTDCGMGFHPVACQMVLVGVQLERGSVRAGQMHMTAGSHRATTPDPAIVDVADWPIVVLDTEPGDCTVHYSHTLHGAPPPSGGLLGDERARRTVYACFGPASLFDALEPLEDLVAVMQRSDGVTATVDEKLRY